MLTTNRSSRTNTYDAIVVGARCAGAATAMLLARRGWRVLVLDRSKRGADTLSTHSLMRVGVIQLHKWGLLDQVIDAGTPPIHRALFRYSDETTVVDIEPSGGVDALYAPRRTVLDPILVQAACDAGAQVRFGVTVTDLERDRSTGRVVGVKGHDRHGDPIRALAPITIGADGVRSRVADKVDATIYRRGQQASALVYSYWSDVEAAGYEWCFANQRFAGLIPTNDGQVCAFVGVPSREFDRREFGGEGAQGWFRQQFAQAAGAITTRLDNGTRHGRFHVFPGVRGYFRKAHGPGWALVGDATYFKDPISAHGISDALRDSQLLVDALEDESSDDPLAGYQEKRDELSDHLSDVTDRLAGYDWTPQQVRHLLVDLSKSMKAEVDAMATLAGVID